MLSQCAKLQIRQLCRKLWESDVLGLKLLQEDPDWQIILRVKRKVGRLIMGEGSQEKKGRHRWACSLVLKCHGYIISLPVSASIMAGIFSLPIHWIIGCYSWFSLCHLKHNTKLQVPLSSEGCSSKVPCWTYIIIIDQKLLFSMSKYLSKYALPICI